jgi:hypothetical protein
MRYAWSLRAYLCLLGTKINPHLINRFKHPGTPLGRPAPSSRRLTGKNPSPHRLPTCLCVCCFVVLMQTLLSDPNVMALLVVGSWRVHASCGRELQTRAHGEARRFCWSRRCFQSCRNGRLSLLCPFFIRVGASVQEDPTKGSGTGTFAFAEPMKPLIRTHVGIDVVYRGLVPTAPIPSRTTGIAPRTTSRSPRKWSSPCCAKGRHYAVTYFSACYLRPVQINIDSLIILQRLPN